MPLCPPGRIGTLRELHGAAVDSLQAASKIVASSLGTPESYVQVELKTDVPMVFGGTDEPTAACTLSSIGAIGGDKNKDISAAICAHLEEYYGIQPGRCARPPSRPRGSAPSSKPRSRRRRPGPLRLAACRVYINFFDMARSDVGYNGGTFA